MHTRSSMTKCPILLFALFFSLLACSENNEESKSIFLDPIEHLPDEGDINFENPKVGQRSRYRYFEAIYSYETKEVSFTYHMDTLVIAITEGSDGRWIVKEFLTGGSDSRSKKNSGWGHMVDSVFQSNLSLEDDSIYFYRDPEDWFVTFAFQKDQKFPFSLVSNDAPKNDSALPRFNIAVADNWTEYIEDFDYFGKLYPRLNIYYDYREVASDGWGYMYVYGPSDGIIRYTWISAWSPEKAVGWDLILRE